MKDYMFIQSSDRNFISTDKPKLSVIAYRKEVKNGC